MRTAAASCTLALVLATACTDATAPHLQSDLVSVSAGDFFSCGLTSRGVAYCWGGNFFWNLGNGSDKSSSVPVAVSGGHTFVSISAGGDVACGLTAVGAAYCWGARYGYGSSTPAPVGGGLALTTVAANVTRDCGLTAAGAAYCWSGTGSEPATVPGGLTFVSVSAGWEHVCGVTAEGAGYCWGGNRFGQLGTGDSIATDSPTTPVAVAGGLTFAMISAGWELSCGVTTSGGVYCWGSNESGQLGNGWTTWAGNAPVPVSGSLSFASVSAGKEHACGLTHDGTAYCWGLNADGELGVPPVSGQCGYPCSPTPVAVSGGLKFAAISAGNYHTCGLATNGVAYCWGDNLDGQLGNGSNASTSTPTRVAGQP
jgi:alpha-tubulin suppressor-like RCC1 family protein